MEEGACVLLLLEEVVSFELDSPKKPTQVKVKLSMLLFPLSSFTGFSNPRNFLGFFFPIWGF